MDIIPTNCTLAQVTPSPVGSLDLQQIQRVIQVDFPMALFAYPNLTLLYNPFVCTYNTFVVSIYITRRKRAFALLTDVVFGHATWSILKAPCDCNKPLRLSSALDRTSNQNEIYILRMYMRSMYASLLWTLVRNANLFDMTLSCISKTMTAAVTKVILPGRMNGSNVLIMTAVILPFR